MSDRFSISASRLAGATASSQYDFVCIYRKRRMPQNQTEGEQGQRRDSGRERENRRAVRNFVCGAVSTLPEQLRRRRARGLMICPHQLWQSLARFRPRCIASCPLPIPGAIQTESNPFPTELVFDQDRRMAQAARLSWPPRPRHACHAADPSAGSADRRMR